MTESSIEKKGEEVNERRGEIASGRMRSLSFVEGSVKE